MQPEIILLEQKKCIGMKIEMSLAAPKNHLLWGSFMPRRKEITNNSTTDLFSLSVYKPTYFEAFKPTETFTKWALVEVSDFDFVPNAMEPFIIESGLYAIFKHRGDTNAFYKTMQYIFETWLPNSAYVVDDRPHFEILGAGYKNGDPNSEEEVAIPIKISTIPQ